jgi:hypothetical protein
MIFSSPSEIIDRLDKQADIAREYREEVLQRLARIEENSAAAVRRSTDHEDRIRSVERKQWLVAGFSAAVGGIFSKFGFHLPLWQP